MLMKSLCMFFATFIAFACLAEQSDLLLEGEFIQGGTIRGKLPPGSTIRLGETTLQQSPQGDFVFGFGRDHPAEILLSWQVPGKQLSQRSLEVAKRDYPTQRVDGVPQQTVTPNKDKLARIRKESALVKTARQAHHPLHYFTQDFIQPLDGPRTGVYGSQRIYNGVPKRPHYGVDYAAPVGTIVKAPADALVTLVHADMYYSGGTLIMDHGYGLSSTFIHLSEVLVKEGQQVKQGEAVGKVGSGGRSTGPHLDWRLNWYEVRLDPELILPR